MPEADELDPSEFTLPPRAGGGTLFGLQPQDFLAALGGVLGGVRLGRGPLGGGIRPFQALFPIAQGLENSDERARNQAAVKGLAAKYGGQNNPEYDAALETMVQDPRLGAQLLFKAITSTNQIAREQRTSTNQLEREQRKTALEGQTGVDVASLLGNIKARPITSVEPIEPGTEATGGIEPGTGDILNRLPPLREFTRPISRPRTRDEMVQGLQALPPERQGLAAEKLRDTLEKQRVKDADLVRDAGDARAAVKALGGSRGLYTAAPEELESAALMMQPGTRFGAQLQIIANSRRSGDARKAAQAARDANADFQRLYLTGQQDLAKSNAEFNQSFRTGQAEQTAGFREAQLQLGREGLQLRRDALDAKVEEWGRRVGERKGKLSAAERKTVEGLAHMDLWHQQATESLEKMRKANLLPTGKGGGAGAMGWVRRNALAPNDPALREWQALQPGIVGFDRSILKDVGVQSIRAHAGALHFFDSPPTYEGAKEVLRNMREQLDVAKTMMPTLIQKYQSREGIGPEESRPQGAPAPAPAAPGTSAPKPAGAGAFKWELVPDAGAKPTQGGGPSVPVVAGQDQLSRRDPLYGHARGRGMTDQQIQKKYGLILVP